MSPNGKWATRSGSCVHGCNVLKPKDGSFAEFIGVRRELVMRIPGRIPIEECAGAGVGVITVSLGLDKFMGSDADGLNANDRVDEVKWILIYGGSTATGDLTASSAGFRVVATCSPHNFDYHYPACGPDIRAHTLGSLFYVWDCVGGAQAFEIADQAFPDFPPVGQMLGHGTIKGPSGTPRPGVEFSMIAAYSAKGEPFVIAGQKFEASREDYEFVVKWCQVVERFLEERKWRPHKS
ncbi:hypothetical protein CC78DRAFT_609759 [Lojkania enalia]|uniref:Uncharacterized protein n=1 Tax=Lojkania enalia TaxID=147567 RepID=A0A9P4K2C0_9PLEO|nr:hypothetical protein CC78DRAFT_609759 [Didymosphaeria enalia]